MGNGVRRKERIKLDEIKGPQEGEKASSRAYRSSGARSTVRCTTSDAILAADEQSYLLFGDDSSRVAKSLARALFRASSPATRAER